MKTCIDYKEEILKCIQHIKESNYQERYNKNDDYELESMWYSYKEEGYSYFYVTIDSKMYCIAPWSNDIDFVLTNLDSITYVIKDDREDTVVGNIEDFLNSVNPDLLICDYTRYVRSVGGVFTKEEILKMT